MTDIPTITQEEAVEVRARKLLAAEYERLGVKVSARRLLADPGADMTQETAAMNVIAALSPNMDHAVCGLAQYQRFVQHPLGELLCSLRASKAADFSERHSGLRGSDWDDGLLAACSVVEAFLRAATPPVNQDAVREALEQIAANNWKDQSRARHVARAALATPPLDNTGLDAATVERCAQVAEEFFPGGYLWDRDVDACDASRVIATAIRVLASGDRS